MPPLKKKNLGTSDCVESMEPLFGFRTLTWVVMEGNLVRNLPFHSFYALRSMVSGSDKLDVAVIKYVKMALFILL